MLEEKQREPLVVNGKCQLWKRRESKNLNSKYWTQSLPEVQIARRWVYSAMTTTHPLLGRDLKKGWARLWRDVPYGGHKGKSTEDAHDAKFAYQWLCIDVIGMKIGNRIVLMCISTMICVWKKHNDFRWQTYGFMSIPISILLPMTSVYHEFQTEKKYSARILLANIMESQIYPVLEVWKLQRSEVVVKTFLKIEEYNASVEDV
ncbi:LOW QUALITY PROTEIN: hypothetical protein Cgig2_023927 [Carnegiea gigantea]|uniref:Uncharacterized protein n=1 Tax=Carnegiea gigantea TaxID=171969 RepID=A0A9Q1JQ85_9CARY|nr:LOW QUALITY PROTEIN: hypothetical protein Cgig2_023927 [Carnegiea gigantea]